MIVKENICWDRRMPSEFNCLPLDKEKFIEQVNSGEYVLAYRGWLRDVASVPFKIVTNYLYTIENEEIFKEVLKVLASEGFDFCNPTSLCEYVYKLYRTNREKYDLYRSELEKIDDVDYYIKAAFGMCASLDKEFSQRLIKTNNKKLILRVFSLLPIHSSNIKKFIEYDLLSHLEQPVLRKAYSKILHGDVVWKPNGGKDADSRKLNIAVCVSGQLRGYKDALESWSEFGLNKHNVDTYVCAWKDIGRKKLHPAHIDRIVPFNVAKIFTDYIFNHGMSGFESKFPSFLKCVNDVKNVEISELESVYDTRNINLVDDADYTGFSNMEKMHMMIDKCWSMIPDPKVYDLIIRIRPDKELLKFDVDLNEMKAYLSLDRIFTDAISNIHTDDVYMGDQFAIGSPKVMEIYSKTYTRYNEKNYPLFDLEGYERLKPHSTLYANMLLNDIDVCGNQNEIVFGKLLESAPIEIDDLVSVIEKDVEEGSELHIKLCNAIASDRKLILD